LDANKQLGDLDGIAAASWDLAAIDLARQDHQALAAADKIGMTGLSGQISQLLAAHPPAEEQ
jgi:hypothetical protein